MLFCGQLLKRGPEYICLRNHHSTVPFLPGNARGGASGKELQEHFLVKGREEEGERQDGGARKRKVWCVLWELNGSTNKNHQLIQIRPTYEPAELWNKQVQKGSKKSGTLLILKKLGDRPVIAGEIQLFLFLLCTAKDLSF